jgi:CHAT domain-containing protein
MPSYGEILAAKNHMRAALEYEYSAKWSLALAEYEATIAGCNALQAPEMAVLAQSYKARVLRNMGKLNPATELINAADRTLAQCEPDRTTLYVRSELETIWGTLYLKMPLPQDQLDARTHFLAAIDALDALETNVKEDGPFAGTAAFLLRLGDRSQLLSEIIHNRAINRINLAELYLREGDTGRDEASHLADEVLDAAEQWNDLKLFAAGARIKGQVAEAQNDMASAAAWFEKSLAAYERHGVVNPEVKAAVRTRLLRARTILGLEAYEQENSPQRLTYFDKIPRLIVYANKPFLLFLDRQANNMPPDQAALLYEAAAHHWEGADWQDRSYACLVKAIECIDRARVHQLIGGEFYAQRRSEYFSNKVRGPFHHLLLLLLLPETQKRVGVKNPVAEAFYYREKCGCIGLLDELETARALVSAHTECSPSQLREVLQPELPAQTRGIREQRSRAVKEFLASTDLRVGELIAAKAASLVDVQRMLPADTVLIEYVLTDVLFAAFVITSDSAAVPILECSIARRHTPQVLPDQVIQNVRDFLEAIGSAQDASGKALGIPVEADLDRVKQQGKWLYDVLLRPLASVWRQSSNISRLVIVPHGVLHHLPFAALYDGAQFLAEIVPSVQAPSASILAHCYAKRPAEAAVFTYFGIANPHNDLPGCDAAILAAARQLGYTDEWRGDRIENKSRTILGIRHRAATRSAWMEHAPNYTCLDLATHGSFSNKSPLSHQFLVTEEGSGKLVGISARDIFLHVQLQAELVVAAMCYSGQMKISEGDEPGGLVRAFLFAGSRSVLLYPWALNDRAATAFTTEFYKYLVEYDAEGIPRMGSAKDVALQHAQVYMLEQGRQGRTSTFRKSGTPVTVSWEHPYFWAWILIGDHA